MKALVIIASALFAFTASAGEYSKPVSVLFQSASTWVPAEKVCRDGDYLKHKTKATVEVSYCSDDDGKSNCKIVSKALIQPVVSTAERCANYSGSDDKDCTQWVSYTLNQSSVKVYSYSSAKNMQDGESGTLVGKYTIPACASGAGEAN